MPPIIKQNSKVFCLVCSAEYASFFFFFSFSAIDEKILRYNRTLDIISMLVVVVARYVKKSCLCMSTPEVRVGILEGMFIFKRF